MLELIFYILSFVAAFLTIEGVLLLFGSPDAVRRARASRRLRALATRLQAPESGSDLSLLRGSEKLALLDRLYSIVPRKRAFELRLYRSGITMTPTRFLALMTLASCAAVTAGVLLWQDPLKSLPLALVGLLPWLFAGRRASRRMLRFEEQFPEALELIARAMRAGHSLTFAFQLIGDELPDPIGPEFAQVAEEVKLGHEVRLALQNLSYRVDAQDLPYFVTAVLVQRETGGNLSELLDGLGLVIRDRLKLAAKVRSLTSVGKITANILGLWPAFMTVLLLSSGATFVELLWSTRAGNMLALAALLMVVTGYVFCRRAAQIRV